MLHARSQRGAAAGLAAGCCAAARARLRARGGRVDLQALRRGQRGRAVALQLLHGRQARLGRGRRAARGVALAPRVRQLGLQAADGRDGGRLVALQLLHGGHLRARRAAQTRPLAMRATCTSRQHALASRKPGERRATAGAVTGLALRCAAQAGAPATRFRTSMSAVAHCSLQLTNTKIKAESFCAGGSAPAGRPQGTWG